MSIKQFYINLCIENNYLNTIVLQQLMLKTFTGGKYSYNNSQKKFFFLIDP